MVTRAVLLVLTKIRPEERSLINALELRGLKVIVSVDGRDLGWLMQGDGESQPCVALLRCLSQSRNKEVASLLDAYGIPTVNTLAAVNICCSKVTQALLFKQNDIPAPESHIAFSAAEIERLGARLDFHFVLKPSSSSWGRGVTLIRNRDCLAAWLSAWETHDAMFKGFPILVQRFVEKPGYDLRVVVVGSEPVVAFRRATDHWKTNTHLGASVVPCEVTDAIRVLTAQVVDAVGEGIYGLDLFEQVDSQDLLVCEINQNPEFAKSSVVHGVDIANAIAEWLERQVDAYEAAFMDPLSGQRVAALA